MPNPRPAVMKVTEAAAEQIRGIIARAEKPVAGVRVGLEKGGCAGMSYQMDLAEEVGKGDEVIETAGGRVLVDPKAVLYLLGSEMDFVVDKLSAKVMKGGSGVWGQIPMPPNAQVPDADIKTLVAWILTL